MKLAVVGIGLASPAGFSSSEHAFFLRAGVPLPEPSPFLLASGERLPAAFCPWIGARASAAERAARLGLAALYEATQALQGAPFLARAPLFVCASSPRPGFSAADRAHVERTLAARMPGSEGVAAAGEAGVFAALAEAVARTSSGRAKAAVLVAVDSLISIEALTHLVQRPPSPWATAPPMPSEAAAALVVMDPAEARRARVPILGVIHGAAVATGTSTDADDAIVDGAGMTRVIRSLPSLGRIGAVFGQLRVDSLRMTEWLLALARCAEKFEQEHEVACPESAIGAVGAAAGAVSLVYGLAVMRHGATEDPKAAEAPFLAWAISPDGTRGAAVATGGSA